MSKPKLKLNCSIDQDSMLAHRLQILDYFVAIASVAWGASGLYYTLTGASAIGALCCLSCVCSITILLVIQRRPKHRPLLANLFLLSTLVSLCIASAASGQENSQASLFFPIVVMLTSQLLGMRVTAVWTVGIVAITGLNYYYPLPTSNTYSLTTLDKFINNLGMILTAFWLSFESEKFFKARTRHLRELTESLQEKTRLLELAEETAGVGHWQWDIPSDTVTLSNEAKKICRMPADSDSTLSIQSLIDVWERDLRERLSRRFETAKTKGTGFSEELMFHAGEDVRHVNCRGLCERDAKGNIEIVFGTFRDDTQLRSATDRLSRKAEQLKKLATFDPLTGLTNRFQFQQQLGRVCAKAVENNQQMALLVLDMDGFKEINDSLGHAIGDEVLKVVAERLQAVARKGDVISRLGGDEFTVIIRHTSDEREVKALSKRIVEAIAKPMTIDNQELHVGVSIGASLCPHDSTRPDELFTFADTAMYDAKARKAGMVVYSPKMTEELRVRRSAESRLAGALDREEFRLVYQPQVDLDTGAIMGFECLLRWKNGGEDISPVKFIPLLEGNGKIVQVGQWVLEQACQQIANWRSKGHELGMAINISPLQFREPQFAQRVIDTITRFNIDPTWIELEITEGLLIQDLENTAEKLFQLKSFGTQISVDDFGTGYSSLAYLKHLPIDQLKIDRAFIKDIPEHDDGTIASSIIVLGQSLDMTVLAEGVETQAQLDFLKMQDCNAYQGNFLGKPMSPEACERLMEQHAAKTLVPAGCV